MRSDAYTAQFLCTVRRDDRREEESNILDLRSVKLMRQECASYTIDGRCVLVVRTDPEIALKIRGTSRSRRIYQLYHRKHPRG
jgi:hypothetical protein